MNSRQRRGVLILVLSALCAAAAFFGVLTVVNDVNSKVGPETTAYRLNQDVPAYQPLEPDQFTKIAMPERWLPGTAVTSLAAVSGKIAAAPLAKGSLLQTDMVSDRPRLRPGQQEIAILVDAETGVAGTIRPGDRVNIFATFGGTTPGGGTGSGGTPQSRIIVTGAQVLDIGKITRAGDTSDRSDDRDTSQKVPVTFALSTQDAQRVAYSESFATRVRLALVAPGSPDVPGSQRTYTLPGDKG